MKFWLFLFFIFYSKMNVLYDYYVGLKYFAKNHSDKIYQNLENNSNKIFVYISFNEDIKSENMIKDKIDKFCIDNKHTIEYYNDEFNNSKSIELKNASETIEFFLTALFQKNFIGRNDFNSKSIINSKDKRSLVELEKRNIFIVSKNIFKEVLDLELLEEIYDLMVKDDNVLSKNTKTHILLSFNIDTFVEKVSSINHIEEKIGKLIDDLELYQRGIEFYSKMSYINKINADKIILNIRPITNESQYPLYRKIQQTVKSKLYEKFERGDNISQLISYKSMLVLKRVNYEDLCDYGIEKDVSNNHFYPIHAFFLNFKIFSNSKKEIKLIFIYGHRFVSNNTYEKIDVYKSENIDQKHVRYVRLNLNEISIEESYDNNNVIGTLQDKNFVSKLNNFTCNFMDTTSMDYIKNARITDTDSLFEKINLNDIFLIFKTNCMLEKDQNKFVFFHSYMHLLAMNRFNNSADIKFYTYGIKPDKLSSFVADLDLNSFYSNYITNINIYSEDPNNIPNSENNIFCKLSFVCDDEKHTFYFFIHEFEKTFECLQFEMENKNLNARINKKVAKMLNFLSNQIKNETNEQISLFFLNNTIENFFDILYSKSTRKNKILRFLDETIKHELNINAFTESSILNLSKNIMKAIIESILDDIVTDINKKMLSSEYEVNIFIASSTDEIFMKNLDVYFYMENHDNFIEENCSDENNNMK